MSVALTGAYVRLDDLLAIRLRASGMSAARPRHVHHRAGPRLARLKGRGIDFAEVRLYQPGDDVRAIDWRVTARKAKPHTKIFQEERERPTLLLADQGRRMFFGSRARLKSVAAAEITAFLAWNALASGDRVGAVVLGVDGRETFKPHRSTRSVVRLLGAVHRANRRLERHAPDSPAALETALLALKPMAPVGHRIYVVSDFSHFSDKAQLALKTASRHNEVVCIFVFDPLESDLPPADRYAVTDGRARFELDTGSAHVRRAYHQRFEARIAAVERLSAGSRIRFLPIATTDEVDPLLRTVSH